MDPAEYQAPESCDTFVALPPASPEGTIIFGKNSDRPSTEVQEVIYQAATDPGNGTKVKCTYITIDQVAHTYAVILSKPAWMWGAEMGANDQGICIGNEAIFTKLQGAEDEEERLLGMDLVRLGLERGRTAVEAMKVITDLLEEHGQGGRCFEEESVKDVLYHNSFIVVDPTEAWVLETAGRHWAAEKVTSGVRNISNRLSISTKIDAMSSGLKEHAQSSGLWNGDGEFDFTETYRGEAPSTAKNCPANQRADHRYECGRKLLEKYSADGNFNIQNMFSVLRDEESGICRVGFTVPTGSQVSVLHLPSCKTPCNHWFTATPNPNFSVFKPFIFAPNVTIGQLTVSPKYGDEDPVNVKPRFQAKVDRRHYLYKSHENGENIMRKEKRGKDLHKVLSKLEAQCVDDVQDFLLDFDESKLWEIKDLFKDVVETECKFYK